MAQLIAVILIDVLILTELFIAMYFAAQNPDELTPVFCKHFFSMFVPTLVIGLFSVRFLRDKTPQECRQ